MLSRFCARHGYEADGQFGPKPWLRAFTRITPGAAGGALAWMYRLQAHPLVADALAGELISTSWAREICTWTDRLPPDLIEDADRILLAAAAAGADLHDLALLAAEMLARAAPPDGNGDGFADRSLWLDRTLAGKTGPEDTRTVTQRRHDALEEACQRLIGAGMVPGRDGQPLHVYAHVDLARLATVADAAAAGSRAESRWSLARTVAGPGAWCPTGPDADTAACDATVIPVITGHADWSLADDLISLALPPWALAHTPPAATPPSPATPDDPAPPDLTPPGDPADFITPEAREHLRQLVIQHATGLLSGPAGLAAQLRARTLAHPFTGRSQPLDVGTPTPIIPPHLRRAVTLRDQHCRFPAVPSPPRPARSTTWHQEPRAAPPAWPTWPCCAGSTT